MSMVLLAGVLAALWLALFVVGVAWARHRMQALGLAALASAGSAMAAQVIDAMGVSFVMVVATVACVVAVMVEDRRWAGDAS